VNYGSFLGEIMVLLFYCGMELNCVLISGFDLMQCSCNSKANKGAHEGGWTY